MSSNEKHDKTHHVTPLKVYYGVWIALLVLTVVTVGSSYIDFGGVNNILLAMLIATVKAVLVALYFMGLKYEGKENNVTFFGTFVFLLIFIVLTGADIFYRTDPHAKAPVDASDLPPETGNVDINRIKTTSAELVAKGKTIYGQQCATCHGANGAGNGPAAAALNPKPRDFTSGEWKQGGTPAGIYKTLTNGIPGTPMPAFPGLSVEERFAVAHYIRTFDPKAPSADADTAEVLASLGIGKAPKPRVPVAVAMERMAVASEENLREVKVAAPGADGSLGAKLYGQMCMSCHGADGRGGVTNNVGVQSKLLVTAPSLVRYSESQSEFVRALSEPMTSGVHGFGVLSNAQWSALYEYVRSIK